MITKRNWICNLCFQENNSEIPTYYCTKCDYDVCGNCMKKLSDEEKYPLLYYKYSNNNNITKINNKNHSHPLIYCITSRNRNPISWICNKCHRNYKEGSWSFYCSLCDYDLCVNCYIKSR